MTLLMMFATAGKGDAPPPPVALPSGGGVPWRHSLPARFWKGLAPGVAFRARPVLFDGAAQGRVRLRGTTMVATRAAAFGRARGAAQAGGARAAPGAQLGPGTASVQPRLSLDEVAALLIFAAR